jgi:hypothetical protein
VENTTFKICFPSVRPFVCRKSEIKQIKNRKSYNRMDKKSPRKKILETNPNTWGNQAHLTFLNFLIRPLDHGELFIVGHTNGRTDGKQILKVVFSTREAKQWCRRSNAGGALRSARVAPQAAGAGASLGQVAQLAVRCRGE